MGAPKAYVASMSRVGERGVVSGKFWLADPNEDMAWRNKDWIVEVVDEDDEYQKGRHTFEVVFFKIVGSVDGEEAFTQSEEDIKKFNVIYVTQWDRTYKKNHEKHLRQEATLAKATEIVAQGESSDEEEEDDADNVPQQGPAMPKKRRLEKTKRVTSGTFFVPVGEQVPSGGAMYKQKFSCLLDDNEPIWEYGKAGKKISSSTKRSSYLNKHHKAVYAKYIEPHASNKRMNEKGEVVKLYSLEEAFQKHMKHALVICKDQRALRSGHRARLISGRLREVANRLVELSFTSCVRSRSASSSRRGRQERHARGHGRRSASRRRR